ncbi:SLC13 family permease [Pseudonocardia alni]|uniref:SLC13 family permease n=1 Tax=Pseudonocardia alni TaxID=33907 RepID=UPI00280B1255|nr:SLC13 family permease [Pseudonocardia alni]
MLTAVLSLAVLALVVLVGTVWSVNMGAVAFVAAFLVGNVAGGESAKEILSSFPGDLFVVLVGVTYLFGIAHSNGAIEWVVSALFRVVRGRAAVIPWIFFLLSTAICGIGALSPAVLAILMPVGMTAASSYGVPILLVTIMTGLGSTAGSFSPLGVGGIIVQGVQDANGLPSDPLLLFGASFAFAVAAAVAAQLALRAQRSDTVPASSAPRGEGPGATMAPALSHRLTGEQVCTLAGFVVLVVGALVLSVDVGFLALAIAVVLTIAFPVAGRAALDQISWTIVLLITGILTYVGILQRNGTIDWLGGAVVGLGFPLLAALLICVIGAVISAFASTAGILAAVVPLTVPLVGAHASIGAIGLVVALAISSSLVDVSPFSTGGAIAMANATGPERTRIYRGLLTFAGSMTVAGPLLSWALLVVWGTF